MTQKSQGNPYGFRPGNSRYQWDFLKGKWLERRIDANEHSFVLKARFEKTKDAFPTLTGDIGTEFRWFVCADQIARKVDDNAFETLMSGLRFLVGYKKPKWKQFSHEYDTSIGYTNRVLEILKQGQSDIQLYGQINDPILVPKGWKI